MTETGIYRLVGPCRVECRVCGRRMTADLKVRASHERGKRHLRALKRPQARERRDHGLD